MSKSIFQSLKESHNLKNKFWIVDKNNQKIERVIVEFKYRIISYYSDDPRDEIMIILNHHQIVLKENKKTFGINIKFSLCIIDDIGDVLLELYDNDIEKLILWKNTLHKISYESLYSKYKYIQPIYESPGTKVFKAQSFLDLKHYAIKVIAYKDADGFKKELITHEICILKNIKSSGLIQMIEVFDEANQIALVLEYIPGENLHKRIHKKEKYNEEEASKLMFNLLTIIKCLEEYHVVHKDLKPGNILLCNKNDDTAIKLADFGLSSFTYSTNIDDLCGTPGYLSPEIFEKGQITTKSDIYSCGLILYKLLTGDTAFSGKDLKYVYELNKSRNINFNTSKWQNLSSEAKEFTLWLLEKNPDKRPTPSQALNSKWIMKFGNNKGNNNNNKQMNINMIYENQTIPEICLFGTIPLETFNHSQSLNEMNINQYKNIDIKRARLMEDQMLNNNIDIEDNSTAAGSTKTIPSKKYLPQETFDIISLNPKCEFFTKSTNNFNSLDDYSTDMEENLSKSLFPNTRMINNKGMNYLMNKKSNSWNF